MHALIDLYTTTTYTIDAGKACFQTEGAVDWKNQTISLNKLNFNVTKNTVATILEKYQVHDKKFLVARNEN